MLQQPQIPPLTCKATQINDFPVKILKQSADIFPVNICTFFGFCVNEDKFQNIFKHANITPALKKGYRGYQESYRPMNILPVIIKILKILLVSKEPRSWIKFFRNNNTVFGSIILHKTLRQQYEKQHGDIIYGNKKIGS